MTVFVSPMGEAFRSSEGGKQLVARWFEQADRNQDGGLSLTEMESDADRFFTTLDLNADHEIDPIEMRRYENELVPEVKVGSGLPPRGALDGPPGGDAFGGGGPGGEGGTGGGPSGGGRGGMPASGAPSGPPGVSASHRPTPAMGAARYGLLDIPHPVASADRNFNRGVSRDEFARAASQRWSLLDSNRDGRLTLAELPRPPSARSRPPGR